MSATRIASTPLNSMHALMFQGITVSRSHAQICQMLQARLGDDYARLFAEPQYGPDRIDWYTSLRGSARRLSELPEAERAPMLERLSAMGAAIQSLAAELERSPDELTATRGHVLELALLYPSPDDIYVVGAAPVLCCWGFGPGTPGVEPQRLSRPVPRQIQARDIPAGRSRLLWLLPLALLIVLLLLMFTGFGGMPAPAGLTLLRLPLPPFMANPDDLAARYRQEEAGARSELESLRLRLEAHAASCGKAAEPPPPAEGLRIPEKADNPGFMAGRWLCASGLVNQKSHEKVQFEFAFDASGNGTGVVHEKNDDCWGDASAELADGKLNIRLGPQICRRSGAVYNPLEIECRESSGGRSICRGRNQDGSHWDATFSRIR